MAGAILSLPDKGRPVELQPKSYDSEDTLQELLAEHPSLLAGDQMDPDAPRRWLLVSREMPIADEAGAASKWAIDHLFLDQEGIPTLVEVKRSSDTRLRREVVGQMLDYAANGLVSWPVETIQNAFAEGCEDRGEAPSVVLSHFLEDDTEEEDFWAQVRTNLRAGRIRLVFVADEIPSALLRVVQFLDSQMSPASVHAVEIRQFVGTGMTALVPRVVGQSAAKAKQTGSKGASAPWTEDRFFSALEGTASGLTSAAQSIYEWGNTAPRYTRWGSGSQVGSFHVHVDDSEGFRHTLCAVSTSAKVRIYFRRLGKQGPFSSLEARDQLRQRLNAIPGISIPPDKLKGKPAFELATLKESGNLDQLCEILEWAQGRIVSADEETPGENV